MDTTFIDELASAAPTPGGGGASAYVGALASALASMVGNLTVGKKAYAQVEAEVYVTLEKLADVRERLLELVDEDARAFSPLAAAYRMPKATPEEQAAKNEALQAALVGACDVPLEIMERVSDVVELTDFLAHNGSKMALSDAVWRRRSRVRRRMGPASTSLSTPLPWMIGSRLSVTATGQTPWPILSARAAMTCSSTFKQAVS